MRPFLKTLALPALILAASTAVQAGQYAFSVRNDTGSHALVFVDSWVHSAQMLPPGHTGKFHSGTFHSVTMVYNNGSRPVLIQTPYSEIRPGKQVCDQNDNFLLTKTGVTLWR